MDIENRIGETKQIEHTKEIFKEKQENDLS